MQLADIGVYGIGTMGTSLALNLAENGFRVAVSNREVDWIAPFLEKAGPLAERITGHEGLEGFVAALTAPRVVLFMIPSGAPMDEMIAAITPLLEAGDTIIDAGNADFNDTQRRAKALVVQGLHFVGMGVSGGEEGARTGPSMMMGGSAESWARLRPMAEAIAAKFEDDPCVDRLGPDGAGHFVKTVHNGIEYADMQIIAEVYGLLRDGAGWPAPEIGALFAGWRTGALQSYLVEATAEVLQAVDPETGKGMVDVIEDRAGQKGTGRWTVIEALKLGQSASGIEAAVGARSWSSEKALRQEAEARFGTLEAGMTIEGDTLGHAFEAARILAHAQGFAIMAAASEAHGWGLDPARIAEIWRAGCIIRSGLLDDIAGAFRAAPGQPLWLNETIAARLAASVPALRQVVGAAVAVGVPVPAMGATLAWFDSMRQGRGTANLIQGQRDFFGAHGFRRVDRAGHHHGPWGA